MMNYRNIFVALAALFWCNLALRVQAQEATVPPLVLADGESPLWTAGSVDRQNVRDGLTSRLWQHGKDAAIGLTTVPANWSAYNALTFWLYAPKATGASFMMIISSENPATEIAGAAISAAPAHRKIRIPDFFSRSVRAGWSAFDPAAGCSAKRGSSAAGRLARP